MAPLADAGGDACRTRAMEREGGRRGGDGNETLESKGKGDGNGGRRRGARAFALVEGYAQAKDSNVQNLRIQTSYICICEQ